MTKSLKERCMDQPDEAAKRPRAGVATGRRRAVGQWGHALGRGEGPLLHLCLGVLDEGAGWEKSSE